MRNASFLTLISAVLAVVLFSSTPVNARLTKNEIHARRREAVKNWQTPFTQAPFEHKPRPTTFENPRAAEFYVNGATIPEVDFDVGSSWAGLLPISDKPDESRKLFFWLFPPDTEGSSEDLIIWLNGGPGCSSLEGLLQENGPFSWGHGQAKPTRNKFSWTRLSNVLWVEQPVGTGFSQGTPNIRNEDDLAEQFVGFLQQFLEVFSNLKNKKLYLTGESYAGMYVPYIANYIYEHPGILDLNLQGIWIADPSISWLVVQTQVPAANFVHKFEHVFALNQTTMEKVDNLALQCNYTGYMDKYVTYPPKGLLPLPGRSTTADEGCDVWQMIFNAALLINPAFNVYRILDTYPILWDVLGFPGSFEQIQAGPLYFDRHDVKEKIHAPHVRWTECARGDRDVFPHGGDGSLPSSLTVLPNVIEKSKRSVILHGLVDYVLIADGTRIAIQNMTWNGLQGFQTPIEKDSFIVDGIGALGNMHSERGLTYFEVALSGHMVPAYSPRAAFQTMEYLMGFREKP